jgi:hypothetical protein
MLLQMKVIWNNANIHIVLSASSRKKWSPLPGGIELENKPGMTL